MRLLFAATIPETLDLFMRGQLAWLASLGHEVHVVSSPGPALDAIAARERVTVHAIPMEREISLAADARALGRWVEVLRRTRPDVVVVGTPKAALLGGLSAWAMRVPRRVYLMRGARFEGSSGLRAVILRGVERMTCATAHRVIAVSPSLARLALESGVVPAGKLTTVGAGSSNGVDDERFRPPTPDEHEGARARWGLARDDVAVAFVGRLHQDKGLELLQRGVDLLADRRGPRIVLLVAGSDDGAELTLSAWGNVLVRRLGHVADVPALLHAADLLVLPTQREGFPNVVLEAAASGLPVVTTDATGAVDSVEDGVTGFCVPKGDGVALASAIAQLADDPALRTRLGSAARKRIEATFSRRMIWDGMYREYIGGLGSPTEFPRRQPDVG